MTKNLICIVCPRGCHLTIDENMNVSGNTCKRGEVYARNEVTHPTRMITSTVRIIGGELERLPVATSAPIPKEDIFKVMAEINKASNGFFNPLVKLWKWQPSNLIITGVLRVSLVLVTSS